MTGTSAAVQAACRRSAYRLCRTVGRKAEYSRFSVLPRPEIHRNLRIKDSVKIDPACGSGNFLTETYLSIRRIENDCVMIITGDQIAIGEIYNPIQVSINQFYGIEINDFAVSVAKTALWIAESQMMKETAEIIHQELDFLPLKTNANIVEGNALRLDWESVVPKEKLNYIMGNPPFVGYTYQSKEQKSDLQSVMPGIGKNIDYVSGWYFKAAQLMQKTTVKTAFVSTNSITQGEQVPAIWMPLQKQYDVQINFAHRTFQWDSEANLKAHVHCVIIGFSTGNNLSKKILYSSGRAQEAEHINPYLVDAPSLIITKRSKPLCTVPVICKGSQPTDGGNLIIKADEYNDFIREEPKAEKYIKLFLGASEFISGKKRYCLWLKGISPKELSSMPMVIERVKRVKETRESSKKAATKKWAETPTLFTEDRQPDRNYIAIPEVSSENRRYIPMGFLSPEIICSNKLQLIPDATYYHFGVLESNVHMAWMRTVCGRLEMRYDYSGNIVYNNFPWPTPTDAQRAQIEKTAQEILDARALYPDSSLADLYDELTMPPELRRAHQRNDRAVMTAYGFHKKGPDGKAHWLSESECVAELMKMYQELTKQ